MIGLRGTRTEGGGRRTVLSATQLFLLSFAALIAVGTIGLLVLPGLYSGASLGFFDALFTATSAVCVTGLIVADTATYFTPLGQAWLAILIQLGGLGMLTFATLVIRVAGRRGSLEVEAAAGGHASAFSHVDEVALVRSVVGWTLSIELVGAAVLWAAWRAEMGSIGAAWPALFHAISAFCNAGFSIFSDSLVGFRSDPLTILTVAVLIVLGGLGFVVLVDLRARYVSRSTHRLATHSRLVLMATALLLVAGAALFLFFEWTRELAGHSWMDRGLNSLFMSVTARTAGFNTVDYDAVANPSLFLTIMLMVIGGSPGSTAGGIKTTAAALLVLVLWTRLRGRHHVSIHGRTIPEGTVQTAVGVSIGGVAILAAGVFGLAMTELSAVGPVDRVDFLRLVFDAHSAFGTVGLSMGATSGLTDAGKMILVALMYLGRVGPLAVASAMAFATGRSRPRYRYAVEDVVIG